MRRRDKGMDKVLIEMLVEKIWELEDRIARAIEAIEELKYSRKETNC